jgi:spore maturation protein CgeB
MSKPGRRIVVLGLSLSSSWGNGHATTYRALLRGLARHGYDVLFLERDVPWYAANRDLACPDFCDIGYYCDLEELVRRFGREIESASQVIVGSYVPDGIELIDIVLNLAQGTRAFYDIDTPVTLAALARGDCPYISRLQIPLLDLYLSFSGGPVLERLAQEFGARRPRALYCAVDALCYAPCDTPILWELGYLGTYSADRQPQLDALLIEPARRLPQARFVVAGPQYPSDIEWPANVERIEHLSPAAHARFYGAQRFTLNITRADMAAAGWSPSVWLFEAAACGTPIISDSWPGLTELLPEGEAIAIARTTDDVVDVLTHMSEATRQHMRQRARSIVLAAHTGDARASELGFYLAEAPPGAARKPSDGELNRTRTAV